MKKFHRLKTWTDFYPAIEDGSKTFEVRFDDRGFAVGDYLVLDEFIPAENEFTGRSTLREVTYILRGEQWGIRDGFCAMGIRPIGDHYRSVLEVYLRMGYGRDDEDSATKLFAVHRVLTSAGYQGYKWDGAGLSNKERHISLDLLKTRLEGELKTIRMEDSQIEEANAMQSSLFGGMGN